MTLKSPAKLAATPSSTAPPVLAPHNLPFQLFLLVQQMTKRLQVVLGPHGLTPLHWGILCCLWQQDGLRTSEIAQKLEQLGGTITIGLDTMQRRGLIRRRQNKLDRRVSQIFLTPKARSLQPRLEPAAAALVAEIFACLSSREYCDLFKNTVTLRQHLGHPVPR